MAASIRRRGTPGAAAIRQGGTGRDAARRRWFERPTRPAAVIAWTRQLALLLRAGVPLAAALEAPALAHPDGWHGSDIAALARMRAAITQGSGFAQALAQQTTVFDPFGLNTLAAAELTGTLEAALERIAARSERRDGLRRTVQRALVYPAIVAIVAGGAIAALLIFVIPVFAEIFAEFGEALPLPTRAVVAASRWAVAAAPAAIPVAGLCLVAAVSLRRQERVRRKIDAIAVAVPLLGPVVRASAVSNAMETLGGLVAGGIPLFEALPVAAQTSGNARIGEALEAARRRLADGSSLAQAFSAGDTIPPLAVQMIAVGEESGALDTVLESVARIFRDEADRRTAALLALLEPAIVLLLAVGVGGVVVAMYLPIFRLGAVVG
jgi:type IV pilus assembly protein PilC